jgi:Fic family protein
MRDALNDLEKYLHAGNGDPPLVRLAFIHYQFEAIHPFVDGNGRIGRLLLVLLLVHWDLLPSPMLYLSAFFERHRQEYYDLLMSVSQRSAWRDWLLFFLRGISEQSLDAITRTKRLQDLDAEWRAKVQKASRSNLTIGIVDALFDEPVISAAGVVERFGGTRQGALVALRRLEALQIIEELPRGGRNRLFWAKKVFEVLQ